MAPFNIKLSDLTLDNAKKELQPSVLKGRAQALNDRYSSPSTASTSYANRHAAPPPPRAPKPGGLSGSAAAGTSSGYSAPPPPTRRTGPLPAAGAPPSLPGRGPSPSLPQREEATASETEVHAVPPRETATPAHRVAAQSPTRVDWKHLSSTDKTAFFSLLDDFFSASTQPATALRGDRRADVIAPPIAPTPKQTQATHTTTDNQPPPPPLWARPSPSAAGPKATNTMSYPPPCSSSSHAHDIASYFTSSSAWDSAWFASDSPVPPPLVGRKDMTWTSSWQQSGTSKTLLGAAMFCDLSVAWWNVSWNTSDEGRAEVWDRAGKKARYMDAPEAFEAEELWEACATYGEQVAQFAEEAERRGVPVAHGECWDLASEALAAVSGLPPPIPSIARTHGHLIYSGSASGSDYKRDQRGKWRGGDTAVRRGDIVEWRQVRVVSSDGRRWSDLGAPDHTAIIVSSYLSSDPSANTSPTNGCALAPWEVGILEVVEQSLGKPPSRATYNLSGMQSGEVWVYRPVGMEAYLGIERLRPDWKETSSRGRILEA